MTSVTAQRLQGFRRLHDSMMAHPRRADDLRMFDVYWRLAACAKFILDYSTQDHDFDGFISREKAAGRSYETLAAARAAYAQVAA